jgi:hypothetical protein
MSYAITITPLGLRKVLNEIASAANEELSICVNPEPATMGSGSRHDIHRAGELNAVDRVAHFRSAAMRGLVAADPGEEGAYGNRRQTVTLTPLGEEVLAGTAEMPRVPGEQAGGGEVGIGARFAAEAKAISRMERLQRERGE